MTSAMESERKRHGVFLGEAETSENQRKEKKNSPKQ